MSLKTICLWIKRCNPTHLLKSHNLGLLQESTNEGKLINNTKIPLWVFLPTEILTLLLVSAFAFFLVPKLKNI